MAKKLTRQMHAALYYARKERKARVALQVSAGVYYVALPVQGLVTDDAYVALPPAAHPEPSEVQ